MADLSPFMTVLANVEQSSIGLFVRESPSLLAFPFILYLHTLGLVMLAGVNVGIDVVILGSKARPPPAMLAGIYRIMWLGFGVNALSGLALLSAYPAKALTNWVFFAKLTMVVAAMWVLELIKRELAPTGGATATPAGSRVRQLAVVSLVLWTGTIFAGRLLAYTHSILLTSDSF